jgi:hypothetical protein
MVILPAKPLLPDMRRYALSWPVADNMSEDAKFALGY